MFVTVEMRWTDAGVAHFLNLRVPLLFDFIENQAAPRPFPQQTFWPTREAAIVIQEAYHALPVRHGFSVAQIQMDAQRQARSGLGRLYGFGEGRSVGEQRGARNNPATKSVQDA